MGKMDEQILVVKREELFDNERLKFQGYLELEDERAKEINGNITNILVKRRGDMEEDVSYKQLITYALVQDQETGDYLVYERLSKSGEKRLVGTQSVGVGGHTNEIEGLKVLDDLLRENAYRELQEELILNEDVTLTRIGLVNDDVNAVGEVHVGVIYRAEVSSKSKVENGEPDNHSIGWSSIEELFKNEYLEDWSRIIVKEVYENKYGKEEISVVTTEK